MLFAKALFICLEESGVKKLKNYETLAHCLSIVLPASHFCSVLCHRIEFEISSQKTPTTLFRDTSAATLIFAAFGKKNCQKYIQAVVLRSIAKVIEIVSKGEINGPLPARVWESLPDGNSAITEVAKTLLENVINSIEVFPPLLRRACRVMRKAIQERFPEDCSLNNLPVGIVMLRLVVPTLTVPEKLSHFIDGLEKPPSRQKADWTPEESLIADIREKKRCMIRLL